MRRRGTNGRGNGNGNGISSSNARLERRSGAPLAATAAPLASDQGFQGSRRRLKQSSTSVASSSVSQETQGPWSHGTGQAIHQQRQQQQNHQYYPSGQFHIMGSSPLALTPSLSPLYKVPAPNYYASGTASSVATASAATAAAFSRQSMEETIGRIFTTYLPTFFDALSRFQYQQVRSDANLFVDGSYASQCVCDAEVDLYVMHAFGSLGACKSRV